MNYQNLHLADKSLFTQYRTLFKTNITNAHAVLEDSQLEGKSFLAGDYNDLADDIHTLENNYYSNVPETLNSLLSAFNLDVTRIVYRGTYSSSATYYLYNVVSYTTGGAINLYLCKPANHSTAISNIVPTNTSTWLNLGLQGEQGTPTIGNLKYEGSWEANNTYSVGDVVSYNEGGFYLQSTGTQYIDSGIQTQSGLRIEMDIEITQLSPASIICGNHYYPLPCSIYITSNNYFGAVINAQTHTSSMNVEANKEYHLVFNIGATSQSLIVNGETIISTNYSINTTANNFDIFRRNSSSQNGSYMKLYSCKIYLNNSLLRDFVPIDNNGTFCLYDEVNHIYYINKGTGNFLLGYYMEQDNANNSLYVLKIASPGTTPPPSNSKWVVLASVDRRKINFSTTNLQNGDIYWQELT